MQGPPDFHWSSVVCLTLHTNSYVFTLLAPSLFSVLHLCSFSLCLSISLFRLSHFPSLLQLVASSSLPWLAPYPSSPSFANRSGSLSPFASLLSKHHRRREIGSRSTRLAATPCREGTCRRPRRSLAFSPQASTPSPRGVPGAPRPSRRSHGGTMMGRSRLLRAWHHSRVEIIQSTGGTGWI